MAKKFNAEKALAGIENGGVEATTEVQSAPTKVGAKKFNAEKALAGIKFETPENKERAETMMSIGQLNRDLMGGQLSQIGKDIPDFSNKWAYEYLSTNSEGVDAENIEGAKGAAEAIKKSHSIKQTEPMRGLALKERIENSYDSIRGEATDNDFVATKYAMARNLVDDLPLADPADKEWVMVGDQRMPRGQAEQVLADIVDDTMHPTLLQNNKAYRDNWFIENTGFNAKDYLMSIDETLAKLQQTLNTEVGKEIDAVRSTTTALQMAENAGIDPAIAQAFVTNERYGGKAIRDMRDQIRSLVDNDFSSGVKEGFDAISMMTAGLNDLMAGVELNSVLNKAYNDEPLTEREKIAFEAYVVGQQIDELEELFGGRSWINRVGQGVGTSAEMAVGFMAGTGVAGNIGKLSSLPIRAAVKSVRRAAQKGTWNALKTAVVRSGQLAGRSLKNVAVAEGAGLIAAPLLPSTYATFAEKRNEQFSVENGRIVYKPTRAWKDVIDSWIEGGTEIGSEVIGARIGELIGGSARAFGRALALDKLAAKAGIGKASNMLFGWQKPAAFKALERSVGYQGAVAEPLSEVWGDALSNLMKEGITGNGDLSQLKDVDYWTTTLATCAIYGGSLQAASAPHAIARYSAIAKEGVARKKALSKIGSTELHDKVVAALSIDNIDDAAKAFASIDWGNSNYHRSDIGYAMDALRADYAQRVAIANQVEDGRMSLFLNRAEAIDNMEYRGTEGMTPKGVIKVVTDKNGVAYTALQGDKSKEFYICLDANGNKVSIPSSTIVSEKNYALTDQMMYAYSDMYSVSNEQERQRNIIAQYNRMRKGKGSAEAVKTVMDVFGVTQYRSGDDVTLVNGETATVEDFVADTGEFVVSLHNGGMETVPFYSVLSESELTADAQKLNNSADVVTNVEAKLDVEERAETTTEPRTTRFVEGDIVITPAGEKARVREVNEDGTYEVDYNTAETVNVASMVLESFAEADLRMEGEEVAQTEAPATEEAEVVEAQPTAETIEETTIPEAKSIPTNEDGSINFDAIEDPEQFATLYEREVGSREAAMADVVEMRDSAQADLAESLKKGKKFRNANDKIANRKAQQALAERVDFYNKVLDVLAPAEVVEQTTEAEVSVEAPFVGLIRSEMDADLRSDIAETIDAMAKALGVRVRFVDAVADGTANAEIVGNEVRIAWMKRDSAVSFLVGHEFTHRMQDLSPEAYAAFKESVKKYLGEEAWNARITETKKRYKNISEAEIEDETLADFVGEMVENEGAFVKYLEANKENKSLLESIAEVFKAIFEALAKVVKRNDAYTDVLNKLNTLISTAEAEAKANEGADPDGNGGVVHRGLSFVPFTPNQIKFADPVTYDDTGNVIPLSERFNPKKEDIRYSMQTPSLVGVHNISLDKLRKVIKMGGLANPSVAVIDVDKQTHDDYGEYSLILPKNMVDARQGKNAGTWAGDAWTPTYPQVVKRMTDDKAISRFYKDIDTLPDAMRSRIRLDFDSFMEGRSANSLAYWYLFEKGNAPALVYIPSRYPEDITNAVEEATNGSFSMYNLTPEERAKCLDAYIAVKFDGDRVAFETEMQERIDRLTETIETKKSDRVKKWAQDTIDSIKKYGFDYDDVADFIRDVEYDAREKGKVNIDATITAARELIETNNLNSDYDAWRNNLDERYGIEEYIFDGYTNSGNRRYLPHTVENASKWMKKQGRQGAVATFPSFSTFIAVAIPKMTSLESIRKRKALLGKSKEEYDAFREKWENVYYELGKKLMPDAKGFDDYGYWRLIEAVGDKNPKAFIKKEYNIELSEKDMVQLNDMLNAIRTEYPARYFETKFERPLQLSDFVAAVVPNDMPMDVYGRLKDANIEIFEYDKNVESSRQEALLEATDNPEIRFSKREDNSQIFYSNAQYAVQSIKQEKATPEQWLKMIEKAGGLKAGEDKWLGLSDWLKASDKKTLTKDEVLQHIAENDIQIKEIEYAESNEELLDRVEVLTNDLYYVDQSINDLAESITRGKRRLKDLLAEKEAFDNKADALKQDFGEDSPEYKNHLFYDSYTDNIAILEARIADDERYYAQYSERAAALRAELNELNTQFGDEREINSTRLGYTTKGLSNKREIALVVPTIEPYNAHDKVHFGDAGEGRAVAWVRFGETTDAEGKRVLVIDEIQSKRHQDGREKGYSDKRISQQELYDAQEAAFEAVMEQERALADKYGEDEWASLASVEEMAEYERLRALDEAATNAYENYDKGVPSAPFEKNWVELAFKRMLRYAAENGYDYVAWTTGDQQADRYDIGSVVKDIVAYDTKDADGNPIKKMKFRMNNMGTYNIATNMEGVIVKGDGEMKEGMRLSDITGKALAEKIMNGEGEDAMVFENGKDIEAKSLEGEELHIGNEGMKAFYDQMLPSFVKKYTKKWGAEVGEVTMPDLEENNTMHAVNVTDSMRESVMQGQPKFSLRDEAFDTAVSYIKDRAYEYNVEQPIFIAQSAEEYVQMLHDAGVENSERKYDSKGCYLRNADIICLNGEKFSNTGELFNTLMHERTHAVTRTISGMLDAVLDTESDEDVLYIRDNYLPPKYKENNISAYSTLNEIISIFAGAIPRSSYKDIMEGKLSVDEVLVKIKEEFDADDATMQRIILKLLPVIKQNLAIQKELYNGSKEERRTPIVIGRGDSKELQGEVGSRRRIFGIRRGGRSLEGGSSIYGDDRFIERDARTSDRRSEEVASRLSQRDPDMAEPQATEEMVRVYMKRQHQINKANIRKKYKTFRDVAKQDYKEKRAARLDKIKSLYSNVAKVNYILGENIEQTLPYVHQAFAKIARGEVRIKWDNSEDGNKHGLAAELGLKKGEKRFFAGITKGATLYFDEFVHQWWQELGGYENDIDTQDLRNALIEALGEATNANGALSRLREIYDADAAHLDEIIDSYEREEEAEIAEEVAHYEAEVEEFENNKEAKVAEFESSVSFFDELAAVDETISAIRGRLASIEAKTQARVDKVKGKYREMREAVAEVKRLIKETISSQSLASMQRNELRGMLDKLDKARSLADVEAIAIEIENTLLEVQIRGKRKDLSKMLILRLPSGENVEEWINTQVEGGRMSVSDARAMLNDLWRGKNASGVRVSKWIDEGTAKIMNKLRELIQPTLRSAMVEDVDAPVRGEYVRKDPELSMGVEEAMSANEKRINEIVAKENPTEEETTERIVRGIYDSYLRTVAAKQDIQFILEGIDEIKMMYYGMADKVDVRDYKIAQLKVELADALRAYAESLDELNNDLLLLMREGKDALSAFRMQQDAHKRSIIKLGHEAIRIDAPLLKKDEVGVMNRVSAFVRGTINASYWTFQTTLKEIDRFVPNGEGAFYKYFMGAWQEASNNMIVRHSDHCATVAGMIRQMLDIKGGNDAEIISKAIEDADSKILGHITYAKGVGADGTLLKPETMALTASNIMYIIAMWRQPMYRNSLIKHGIEQQTIDTLYDILNSQNEGYVPFMNWVNESFLPDTRLTYDKVHKEMFGASMAKERNYFPARVVSYQENVDVGNEHSGVLPSTITGAIISRKKNALMPDITQNYFKVLMGHLQDMDRWSAFAPLIRDLNTLLSNTDFKNALRAYKSGTKKDGTGWGDLYNIFRNVSAIAVECYRPKSNDIENALMKALKGWATSNISYRLLTAIKQLSSSPIFAVYALDPAMAKSWAKNATYSIAHPKQVIEWARENSPSFRKRWEDGFMGMDILSAKVGEENGMADLSEIGKRPIVKGAKKFHEAIKKFAVEWGMAPNKVVDALAVASGLKAVYEYKLAKIMAEDGNSEATEAQKAQAMKEAEIAFNTTQQSSEGAYLSTVQSDRSIILRALTVYQNSPFAFHRLMLTGANELYKQATDVEYKKVVREEYGDAALKEARRKAYAQMAQAAAGTFLFSLMGVGIYNLFELCAGGEDDGEEYNTLKNSLWAATASTLVGGFVGGSAAISALQGYNFSMSAAWDDLANTVKKLWKMDRLSLESVYTTLNLITTYRYGVDLDTFMNIAKGVDGIFERTGDAEAIMQILNAPQSQINLIAGMRREGESAMDYVVRIMRIQSLVYDPEYKDIYNEKGTFIGSRDIDDDPHKIREYQARKLISEYNDAYTRNVVTHFGGKGKLSEMAEHDANYKAAVESLNWKPEASPSHTQNVAWGEYRAPIENLTIEAYAELAEAQERIAYLSKNIERFGGSEEQYYEMVEALDSLKVNFKIKYDELIK